MRLHELISSEYVKEAPTWPVKGYSSPGNPHIDTSVPRANSNRLPSAANLNLNLDKSTPDSNMTSTFTKKNAIGMLKHVVKVGQGKKPIHTTKGGTDISVDAFGGNKSINFKKTF